MRVLLIGILWVAMAVLAQNQDNVTALKREMFDLVLQSGKVILKTMDESPKFQDIDENLDRLFDNDLQFKAILDSALGMLVQQVANLTARVAVLETSQLSPKHRTDP